MARPRKHERPALIRKICATIANGQLVKDACAEHGITAGQVREWVAADPELSALYARAREDQAHALAEQALSIATGDDLTAAREEAVDEASDAMREQGDRLWFQKTQELRAGVIQRDKMRVDTLKWLASKIAPRNYGEKVQAEVSGTVAHEHSGSITWGNVEIPL